MLPPYRRAFRESTYGLAARLRYVWQAGLRSGLNQFANPEQVYNSFRKVNIGSDGRSGPSNRLYGMPRWNIDASVGKVTKLTERVGFRIGFDFFNVLNKNVLNKMDFAKPSLDLTNPRRVWRHRQPVGPDESFVGQPLDSGVGALGFLAGRGGKLSTANLQPTSR